MGNHLSGRIESFDLVDLIQWLEVRRVSGRLTLSQGGDRRKIDWKDGDIVYVSGARTADRLGYALLRSKAIPVSGLYEALAENLARGGKLTRILLERNLIPRERLADAVEALARRLLREVLGWKRGRFAFDPDYETEDVLQIHLRIKGQVVAFQAVKEIDDRARAAKRPADDGDEESWEPRFRPEAVEESFWEARARSTEDFELSREKERFLRFRAFADAVRARLETPLGFLPVCEDSARLAADLLRHEEDEERLLGLVNFDPFLTLNLLHLANSFTAGAIRRVATARGAYRRIGPAAFRRCLECVSHSGARKLHASDAVARALRRACLAAAVAGAQLAPGHGLDPEEAYSAGLLHAIPYADLLGALETAPMPAGPFRAAAIESFRPVVGAARAEAWRLPADLAAVLADAGEKDPPALVALVRDARTQLPGCALGAAPDRPSPGPAGAAIRSEIGRIFAFLGLGAP